MITGILTIAIVLVSILAFRDTNLFYKFSFTPYQVKKHNEWYRFVTHAFLHADWMHLIFNMLAFYSFGAMLEKVFAQASIVPYGYLILVFGGIIVGSIPSYIKQKNNPRYTSVGASAGVSAVVFSAVLFGPWNKIYIYFIPVPAILFALIYLGYSFYMRDKSYDNVNHDAHLYGSIWGIVCTIVLIPNSFNYFIEQIQHPSF